MGGLSARASECASFSAANPRDEKKHAEDEREVDGENEANFLPLLAVACARISAGAMKSCS
jgi:hypothetical protein